MEHRYILANDQEIRQGEILFGLSVYLPAEYSGVPEPNSQQAGEASVLDGIVITPSCDLVERQGKSAQRNPNVVFCQHWDLAKKQKEDASLNKNAVEEIEKGRRPVFYILPASPHHEVQMGLRIVDFNHVYSLPKPLVQAHARTQRRRLRLAPPYCEHFAQAFARCYMRIGLEMTAAEYSERLAVNATAQPTQG
jgi:hypothetical protein